MRIARFVLLNVLWLITQVGFSQTDDPRLDKYLLRKMKKANLIGLQVAYVTQESIWQGDYGLKAYGTDDRVDSETLFMIASCSKPVTALAILKLTEQGKISLDDPVNKHLSFPVTNPYYPDDAITVRMLLTHVSSFRDNWDILTPLYTVETGGGDSPIPLGEFVKAYLAEGGKYYDGDENFWNKEPTTYFAYSNVGYALLGRIIENVSGTSFSDYMQSEIFEPLGMDESYWFLANIPHDNIARPHEMPTKDTDFNTPKMLVHYGYPDFPDGQLRTTASDYGKFVRMIINRGQVDGSTFVQHATIDEFLKIQYPETAKYQAIAWNYNEFDNWIYYLLMPRLPSHTGADPGVATVVSINPKTRTGAIIFSNSPTTNFIGQKIFYQEMMKKLLKKAKRSK